jgi:hypothetical protein
MSVFEGFPKIGRLKRDMVITEKIDGTNAQVIILTAPELFDSPGVEVAKAIASKDGLTMFAASRTRLITPTDDNYGFAKFVAANAERLWALGPGRHFGEWWGQGIQRNYGLTEKRFSLFNAHRWQSENSGRPACCSVVPVLARHTFDSRVIDETLAALAVGGSVAAPGFMKPEGIIVFHVPTQTMYKRTIDKDDEPKGQKEAA